MRFTEGKRVFNGCLVNILPFNLHLFLPLVYSSKSELGGMYFYYKAVYMLKVNEVCGLKERTSEDEIHKDGDER